MYRNVILAIIIALVALVAAIPHCIPDPEKTEMGCLNTQSQRHERYRPAYDGRSVSETQCPVEKGFIYYGWDDESNKLLYTEDAGWRMYYTARPRNPEFAGLVLTCGGRTVDTNISGSISRISYDYPCTDEQVVVETPPNRWVVVRADNKVAFNGTIIATVEKEPSGSWRRVATFP